jgi:preprotein translocase SecE subunit
VARDRQRAKARRAKRQPGGGGPAAGSASTNARDIGLDQADADDAGLGNTAPPEPTKHAMPDVEEARMMESAEIEEARIAESGMVESDEPVSGVYEDELHDDDELEETATPGRRAERAHDGRPRKRRGRLLTFLRHCVDELRRVQWPDRRQVGQGTAVTLGFVVIAGGYLGLLDAIWKPLIEAIL